MIWFNNPQKKVQNILKKIKNGQASETNITSLVELLDERPSAAAEVITTLIGFMDTSDTKTCSLAISALNMVAEKDIPLVAGSVDAIVNCMQKGKKDFREDCMLSSLEILLKICQKYPERMGATVSELFVCLGNTNRAVREKAYFLLALLTVMRPDFFHGRSKELARALSGLNMDERYYACRLISKIAAKEPKIVEDTYDVLEGLFLYDPDSTMRSEAGDALEKLKAGVGIVKPEKSTASELDEAANKISQGSVEYVPETVLYPPDEKDILNMLEGLKLGHLVNKK